MESSAAGRGADEALVTRVPSVFEPAIDVLVDAAFHTKAKPLKRGRSFSDKGRGNTKRRDVIERDEVPSLVHFSSDMLRNRKVRRNQFDIANES